MGAHCPVPSTERTSVCLSTLQLELLYLSTTAVMVGVVLCDGDCPVHPRLFGSIVDFNP